MTSAAMAAWHNMKRAKPIGGSNDAIEWQAAALLIGERLSDCGPDGYYDMKPYQWLEYADEALKQRRIAIIEECARLCEQRADDAGAINPGASTERRSCDYAEEQALNSVAIAIRALAYIPSNELDKE